jgi:chorismate mutase
MPVRGIRGAAVAPSQDPEDVLLVTRMLLEALLEANPMLDPKDIASILFTATQDLISEYPAKAARQMGWVDVPLMCGLEIPVPKGISRCIRILIHWNTDLPQTGIHHVYLGEAASLRPDLPEYKKPAKTAAKADPERNRPRR